MVWQDSFFFQLQMEESQKLSLEHEHEETLDQELDETHGVTEEQQEEDDIEFEGLGLKEKIDRVEITGV